MSRHQLRVLLLVAGVALSVAVVVVYEDFKFFVAWFWSVEETLQMIARTWIIRRLYRFFTTPLTRWAIIAGIGYDDYGRFKRRVTGPFLRFHGWMLAQWPILSWPYRIAMVLIALGIMAGFFWLTWLIPYALPVTGFVIGKLYWWISDQFIDRTLYMLRWRHFVHRLEHRNKIVRKFFGPYWLMRKTVEPRLEKWREARERRQQQQQKNKDS